MVRGSPNRTASTPPWSSRKDDPQRRLLMAESLPCTAAGADQLPGEVKRLLGQGLPNGASAEYDHGILAGLQFALRLLEAAPLTPEQARTALAAAAGNKKAQVDARNQAELPEVYARLRAEFTAADLAEYA